MRSVARVAMPSNAKFQKRRCCGEFLEGRQHPSLSGKEHAFCVALPGAHCSDQPKNARAPVMPTSAKIDHRDSSISCTIHGVAPCNESVFELLGGALIDARHDRSEPRTGPFAHVDDTLKSDQHMWGWLGRSQCPYKQVGKVSERADHEKGL